MEKKKVYAVATAHLDTVWRWNLATTIEEYIPDTIAKNLDLIEKYPHYRFNFASAFSYLSSNLIKNSLCLGILTFIMLLL